jgi:hypothetical protein
MAQRFAMIVAIILITRVALTHERTERPRYQTGPQRVAG